MKFLYLLILSFFLGPLNSEPECSSIKNGVFTIPIDREGMKGEYTRLQRKGNRQTETTSFDDSETIYKVKWIDECTYLLYDRNQISGPRKFRENSEDTLKVKIFNVTDEFYEATISSNFADMQLNAKIFIEK